MAETQIILQEQVIQEIRELSGLSGRVISWDDARAVYDGLSHTARQRVKAMMRSGRRVDLLTFLIESTSAYVPVE